MAVFRIVGALLFMLVSHSDSESWTMQTAAAAVQTITAPHLCPATCSCSGDGDSSSPSSSRSLTVDCRGSMRDGSTLLMEMEGFLSEHPYLTTLTLGYTTLERVPSAICNMSHLVMLNLDNNRLTSLPRHCFRKSRGLQSFSAQRNFIAHVEDGVFAGLEDLGFINLGENVLTDIPLRD